VESVSNAPVYDAINNVENVYLLPGSGTNFYITVQGYRVNVNAVTAQTNNVTGSYAPNVVQDFALVISYGNGTVTNAFTVSDSGISSAPTTFQQVTAVSTNNTPLLNQLVGASTPLLGTNQVPIGTITILNSNNLPTSIVPPFGTNAIVTVGMVNQWHFYVVTNTTTFTNAAFVTFIPDNLSVSRMGVFAGSVANAKRPEADIDLYVTTDPTLTNLNLTVISNCVHGTKVGLSVAGVFNGSSLDRGGTEYVVDIHSSPGQVYYVGVYAEDQLASEFGFIPIFSEKPSAR
jgi:predicted nucleotidyltransferase